MVEQKLTKVAGWRVPLLIRGKYVGESKGLPGAASWVVSHLAEESLSGCGLA